MEATQAAVHLERQRDITVDPAYGIAQLETIAWTSISTSKSDPAPGILTVYALRDLLGRWAAETGERESREPDALVTYVDATDARLMEAFETLAVVASESMQHQSLVAVLRALAGLLNRLPTALALRVEDIILRMLPSLGDHVLTAALDRALSDLHRALVGDGRTSTAAALDQAHADFAGTIGRFGSRSTRASPVPDPTSGNGGVAPDRGGGRI